MKTLSKALILGSAVLLTAVPAQQVNAFWGVPYYGTGWGNAYVYDPAYRWGTLGTRRYIRDLYRYGPAYAQWRRNSYGWW